MESFRFSYNVLGIESAAAFAKTCQRAERYGYDTVFAPDHLGAAAPFPSLVAAAAATERLKVGTLVLNALFWNSELLAREIATTDVLTEGRLEVGLGAGHMKWEFDAAGIDWNPFPQRAKQLRETILQLGRCFAADGYEQQAQLREQLGIPVLRPVQRHGFGGYGPPLIVGGTGNLILDIAAEHADIISVAGAFQVPGKPPGTLRIGTPSEADERVRYVRERTGTRADRVEWHVLVQAVQVTDDRHAAARALLDRFGPIMTVDELLETPFVLIGSVDEIADKILRNRDRYGFTYYTVHGPYLETFAPVIERVRSR